MNMNVMDADGMFSDLYLCLGIIRRLTEEQYQYVMYLFNMCKVSIIAENEDSLMFRKETLKSYLVWLRDSNVITKVEHKLIAKFFLHELGLSIPEDEED